LRCSATGRHAASADLFADEHHRKKIDTLGDPLVEIRLRCHFAAEFMQNLALFEAPDGSAE
jgi:hypothetical protein